MNENRTGENWLERQDRRKIVLLGAGTKGGSGKSLGLANFCTWYGYKYNLIPKVWDCDRMQTLTQMLGAESIFASSEGIPLQWVIGEVLRDEEHSVFILDTPASSEDQVREAFSKLDPESLNLHGIHVVLVASITKDAETVSKLMPWMEFLGGASSTVLVRNWVTPTEPLAFPFEEGEDVLWVEQGHYEPPELLRLIYVAQQPLHAALFPYLRSFKRRFMEAKNRGSKTALAEWIAIRDEAWANYPVKMRNESNFMVGAMVLDRFYDQLDGLADELLPADFQGRAPGTFSLPDAWRGIRFRVMVPLGS